MVKDYARGITLFFVINACLAIGILMGGYVLEPISWKPFTPEFNLVGILTYVVQGFSGGGFIFLNFFQARAAEDPESYFNIIRLGSQTLSDLGVFHLIVAGALNYFSTVRLYDLLAGCPELSEGLDGHSAAKSAEPEAKSQ